MTRARLAIAVQGLTALVLAAAIVAAVPAALWRLTGVPLLSAPAGGWSGWSAHVSDDALVWLLAQVCWLAWAVFTASFIAEVAATATHRLAPALPVPRPVRRLAAQLVASVVLLGTLAPAPRPQQPIALAAAATSDVAAAEGPVPEALAGQTTAAEYVQHVVQPREDLWSIASDRLGDPYRWRQIWELNHDRFMDDGQRFTHPDHIRPGWTLDLPTPARPAAPAAAAAMPQIRVPASASEASDPDSGPDGGQAVDDPADVPTGPDSPVTLPGGGLVTLSFAAGVTTALALARLHERRRYTPGTNSTPPQEAQREPLAGRPVIRTLVHAAQAVATHPDQAPTVAPGARLWQHGVSLSGDDQADVARGLLLEALMEDPDTTTLALVGERLLHEGATPAATCHPTLDAALSVLEVELVRRTRTLDDADVPDIAALRAAHPQEPAGLAILVANAPKAPTPRLDAVLSLGERLGIRGVLLGRYDHAALAPMRDGIGTSDPPSPRLTHDQAAEVLHALAARNGEPTPVDPPAPLTAAPSVRDRHPTIYVRLFGPLHATVDGQEIAEATRPKALELLAYLLVHPQGVSRDAIVESLWPGRPSDSGFKQLRTVVSRLRGMLRTAAGDDGAEFVRLRPTGHYEIDGDSVDCDLWGFEQALRAARDDAVREPDHLGAALSLNEGELLDGSYYSWVDPIRESVRRRTLDAAARLAELHARGGNNVAATHTLQRAIEIDPYAETLYRRLMALHAAAGEADAVRRTYQRLEAKLSELQVEPSTETVAALRDCLRHGPR